MERDILMEFFFFIKGVIRLSREKVLGTVTQYSLFSVISAFIIQCILFETSWQVSLPPPYTILKLVKNNSGYTRPTLFMGWGKGLGIC